MVQLQDSILECLHHHTLSNMLFNRISKAHCVRILSFSNLGVIVRLIVQTNLLNLSIIFCSFFHNTSKVTWITPFFNYKYPSLHVHTSHWPYGYSFLTLRSWQWAHMNSWCNSWHLYYHCMRHWFPHGTRITTCTSFNHIQLHLSMG